MHEDVEHEETTSFEVSVDSGYDYDYDGPEELPLSIPGVRFTETQLSSLDGETAANEEKARLLWYEEICDFGHVRNKHLAYCPCCAEGREREPYQVL